MTDRWPLFREPVLGDTQIFQAPPVVMRCRHTWSKIQSLLLADDVP